ncbi:cobalamin-binding protein [Burkholderiaceae bacterium DAT-1]|nr:cobalamin-binding protein [Burkholderiaceae bacterium DAT-1]
MVRHCLLALMMVWMTAAQAISVVDDSGHTVTLAQPARRIISLTPHLTEDLFAIGAGHLLVAATDYSDYPAAAKAIPRVGGYDNLDLERIRLYKPDLILAWSGGNSPRQLEQVAKLGLPVYYDDPKTLADVRHSLTRLGELTGRAQAAQHLNATLLKREQALSTRFGGKPVVKVFYQVWDKPLMTINGEQVMSDIMQRCSGRNVFAALKARAPTVDEEAVLAAAPDLIVTSGDGEAKTSWLTHWQRYPGVPAVKYAQLKVLPPDVLSRMGPRLVEGAEALCAAIDGARRP